VIPQTNLQLFAQLAEAGWSNDDLNIVVAANRLATDVLGGAFRASGKPFVCHLVGTAGLVARHGGDPPLVAAALLHAAYSHGDFGDLRLGRTPGRVAAVRRAVGVQVEAHVTAYHRLHLDEPLVSSLEKRAGNLALFERRVLLVLLANEVDDHADWGIAMLGAQAAWRYRPETTRRLVDIGERAGFEKLAAHLDSVSRAVPEDVPQALRRFGEKHSTWVKPRLRSLHRLRWPGLPDGFRSAGGR
jgi:(p)ppGpp synthase/HD superfamily hydrolase